ncbi:MAG TPA: hypothetical protein VGL24_03645 [Chthoniobacterales bacterium]|jgi:hypothetical protein
MRFFLEILAFGSLLFMGWEKPFKHWVAPPPPSAAVAPSQAAPATHSSTAPARNWMWDQQRKTPLDRGSYDQNDHVTHAPDIYPRGSTVPVQTDGSGRRYWVDQYGVTHYL